VIRKGEAPISFGLLPKYQRASSFISLTAQNYLSTDRRQKHRMKRERDRYLAAAVFTPAPHGGSAFQAGGERLSRVSALPYRVRRPRQNRSVA